MLNFWKKGFVKKLSLNNYIFFIFLVMMLLTSVISVVGNVITAFPFSANVKWICAAAFSILGIWLLKINKFLEIYRAVVFLLVLGVVIWPAWFIGGGDNTITLLYLLLVAVVALLVFEHNIVKFTIVGLTIASAFALLVITYVFPELIQHTGQQDVFTDNLIQIAIIFTLAVVLLELYTRRYKKQNVQLEQLNRHLEEMASVDVLSHAFSRRKILELLDEAISNTHLSSLHIVMVDIDLFKTINDRHGHLMGDSVIRHFSKHIKESISNRGDVGRYGGDEFLIILPDVSDSDLTDILQRLVEIPDCDAVQLTLSGGVAVGGNGESATALLRLADDLLFASKKAGRNRITTNQSVTITSVDGR